MNKLAALEAMAGRVVNCPICGRRVAVVKHFHAAGEDATWELVDVQTEMHHWHPEARQACPE